MSDRLSGMATGSAWASRTGAVCAADRPVTVAGSAITEVDGV